MRPTVYELMELGPLPSSVDPDADKLEKLQNMLTQIESPISDEEARALLKLFGPDDCFGLAWSLVHLIETAPGWPLQDCLAKQGDRWIDLLRESAH